MKANAWGAAFAALVFLQAASSVKGEVLMDCGDSSGYGYYLKSDLLPSGNEGWHEDGISGGRLILSREGSDFDVTYKDASGGTYSVRSEGGTVIPLSQRPGRILVLVVHRGGEVTETYLFSSQSREVAWTQAKNNGMVDKIVAFRAACN